MLTLKVFYRGDDGSISESLLKRFQPFGDEFCSAVPLDGEFMRKMAYERIVDAFDVETGEVISIQELCGARPSPHPESVPPKRKTRPSAKKRGQVRKSYKTQRRSDRQKFLMRYGNEVIWNHFRNQLIALFKAMSALGVGHSHRLS